MNQLCVWQVHRWYIKRVQISYINACSEICHTFNEMLRISSGNSVSRNARIGVWCSGTKKCSQMIEIVYFCPWIFEVFRDAFLWYGGECAVNGLCRVGECAVQAPWALCECSVNALWRVCECAVKGLWVLFECSVRGLWVLSECRLMKSSSSIWCI